MSNVLEKAESTQPQWVNVAFFVESILKRISNEEGKKGDSGLRAALTRADNPNTEAEAWPFLARFCDLEKPNERLACGLVAAAIARVRSQKNGTQSLGEALRMCKMDLAKDDESVERKLRRLLACDNVAELISVLRPLLRFITKKESTQLDYVRLLKDILVFGENVKLAWAAQYFRKGKEDDACSLPE